MDLVVAGRALVKGRLVECEIGVAGGRIAQVAKTLPASVTAGARRLAAGRGVILPGAVDGHVHLREPGLEHKETVASGTLAALHGGATTVLEMPNTVPPVSTLEAFEEKARRFEAAARVDWGLHAMVDADLRCFALGGRPVGYKAYLGGSTHAPGLPVQELRAAAHRAALARRPLVVHAEHPDLVRPSGREGWEAHGAARPVQAEWAGILAVAERAGDARVLVAHVTTARGLALARRAGLATEACPHHLLLDDGAVRDMGPRAKVNPPLRGPKERAALWKAFAAGQVDHLGSDHAPHSAEEKAGGFAKAPSGMPGVETLLPVMLARVKAKALGLGTLMHSAALAPARFFGLPKGQITPGFDADLLIVDLAQVEEVRAARLHSKAGWTCFEGQKAVFPRTVLLRGEVALEEGKPTDVRGRPVAPAEAQPSSREGSSPAGG